MIEVFITNIKVNRKQKKITNQLKKKFKNLVIDYDMNESDLDFPCGHTVIRVETIAVNVQQIINIIQNQGIVCKIMKDKICN